MRIGGFQPLSLSDYPDKTCAVVFTQGCPFRCHYCHNPELIPNTSGTEIPEEDVFEELERRKPILEGVCITGGEPTVQPDLVNFLERVKNMGYAVKLDTNGVHPRLLENILKRKIVDYVAMDIKHTFEEYESVIDIPAAHIAKQIAETQNMLGSSDIAHEFRTTVWDAVHNASTLLSIATQLPENSRYALQPVRPVVTLNTKVLFSANLNLQKIADDIRVLRPDLEVLVRI